MPVFSYEVGAIFNIEAAGATGTLERLGEGFTALGEKIAAIEEKLSGIGQGGGLFSGLTKGLEEVNVLFSTLTKSATTTGDAMVAAFKRGAEAATAAAREIDSVAAAMNRAAAASDRMGRGRRGRTAAPGDDFDEGDYDTPPSGRYPGTSLVPLGARGMAERPAGPGTRGGLPAPFYGYPRGRYAEEEQGLLEGPPGFGGFGGPYDRTWPPGGRGGGITPPPPPADANFEERPSLNLNQPQGRRGGSHIVPMVEAAALYEAMKAGAEEEQNVDITLLRAFHIDPRTATKEQKEYLRTLAATAAEGTSFSEREVSAGEFILASPLGLQGDAGMRQFGAIFANAAKAAEAAKQLKFGTFEGSLEGTVEFSHQMMQYDPAKLARSTDLLGRITESVPHGDMAREALIMSYIIPTARALGADPEEAMTATGFLQRAGLNSTIASTTLRQMLLGQSKTGGPMNAQHRAENHERAALENALGLKPGHLSGHGESEKPHMKALHDLGLMDAKGNYTDLYSAADQARDPSHVKGGINVDKMFEIIAHAREKLDPHEFGTALFNYAGVRGETGGAVISEAMKPDPKTGTSIFGGYGEYLKGTMPLEEQLKAIQGNAVQITGQAIARTADLGNAIGTTLLPQLKAFDEWVISTAGLLRGLVNAHPDATAAVTAGGVAASVVGGIMTMRALPGWIAKFFSEGSAEKAGEALRGVGPRVAGAAGGGLLATIGEAVAPAIAGLDIQRYFANPKFVDPRTGEFDMGRAMGMPGHRPAGAQGVNDPEHHTGLSPTTVQAPVSINVGGISITGTGDDSTFRALVDRLTAALTAGMKSALEHAAAGLHGTSESPYVTGGAL